MGRTQRIRKRKKDNDSNVLEPESESQIISLMKWMKKSNWRNSSKIRCRTFETTGRGVSSSKTLSDKDVLIKVPYKLLITYSTVMNSKHLLMMLKPNVKLGIHDILAAFLVVEKHKKRKSRWKYYLDSLPTLPKLPWLSPIDEIESLPEELRKKCRECKSNFEESWSKLNRFLNINQKCKCCGKVIREIFNLESYTWGYIMVNTRGVYVDPMVIRRFTQHYDMIQDEPQIAMFPLMDMFNHSDVAENKVEFKETPEGLFYQLSTLNKYKKNEEIFISYGRHDNIKLFTEYGFYLPKNSNDKIKFTWEELVKCLTLKLEENQFKFLKKHEFLDTEELFISSIGPSFKLKGFLFVAGNVQKKNYSMFIFSEDYDVEFMEYVEKVMDRLLETRIGQLQSEYEEFKLKFDHNKDTCNFLKHRIDFAEYLRKIIPDWKLSKRQKSEPIEFYFDNPEEFKERIVSLTSIPDGESFISVS